MSKTLDESTMKNELAGSAFFRPTHDDADADSPPSGVGSHSEQTPSPALRPDRLSETPPVAIQAASPVATSYQPSVCPPLRTGVRSGIKRTITRYAFELYRDQVDTLQQYRLEELSYGENSSMSQMVREALDAYIAKREGRGS